MRNKKILLTVIIGILSILCSLGLVKQNTSNTVFAATNVECYTMLLEEGEDSVETYVSTQLAGTASGDGKYTINTKNLTLTARAESDYQIVGWKVVYDEQDSKTIFIDTKDLNSNSKEVELKTKDDLTIKAVVTFTKENTQHNIFNRASFELEAVFEDLTVTPVFDHSYYQIKIEQGSFLKQINDISLTENMTDGKTLHYQEKSENEGKTTYTNTIIKDGKSSYYYGTLYSENGKYYTEHNTLEATPKKSKVDYSRGAFRMGENVKSSFDINIIDSDLKNSTNIDIIGANIKYGTNAYKELTSANNTNDIETYCNSTDSWKRSTSFAFNFDVIKSTQAENILQISYHYLYVLDLDIYVDDVLVDEVLDNSSQLSEIFGHIKMNSETQLESNISVLNFYSKNDTNTMFLIKKAKDNQRQAVTVSCNSPIQKFVDNSYYTYYTLISLNENTNYRVQTYTDVNDNVILKLKYSASKYNIDFKDLWNI